MGKVLYYFPPDSPSPCWDVFDQDFITLRDHTAVVDGHWNPTSTRLKSLCPIYGVDMNIVYIKQSEDEFAFVNRLIGLADSVYLSSDLSPDAARVRHLALSSGRKVLTPSLPQLSENAQPKQASFA